jgi:hypothetical protein
VQQLPEARHLSESEEVKIVDPKVVIAMVVAIVSILIAIWAVVSRQRTLRLREHYGPEYERTAQRVGAQRTEAALLDRERRVQNFRMRSLTAEERMRYINEWRGVQVRFVDDPHGAVTDADRLVTRLMNERGYPMAEFEQRAADLSVVYPQVVDNYRAGHEIALRHEKGLAGTEDLRHALIYYRSLFDELLQTTTAGHKREVA